MGKIFFGIIAFIFYNYHYLVCTDINGDQLNTINGGCPLYSQIYGIETPAYIYPYRLFGIMFRLFSLAMLAYAGVGGKTK